MSPLVDGWMLGLAANGVIATAFLAVAVVLAVNLTRTRQWRRNPLATATVALFVTCGGGHAVITLQLLDGPLGLDTPWSAAARESYGEPHMWIGDGITAIAGVVYWQMRRRFPALVTGTAVFEDLRERQRRALEIHDNVVQGIVRAKLSLELNDQQEGDEALRATLASAQRIVDDLLREERAREPAPPPGGAPQAGGG